MVGHSWITYCTQVDGIEGTQLLETIFRHHAAGLEIPLATPIETLPRERQIKTATRRLEHPNALGNHFSSNAVSLNHRYFVVLQDPSQSQIFVNAHHHLLQERRQSTDIRYVFELVHHVDHLVRL